MTYVPIKEEVTTVTKSAPVAVTEITKTTTPPIVQTEQPQKVYNKKKTIFRTYLVCFGSY